ncbi:hypothetical protein [Mycolicibacterium sp.]|uniref:Rv3212 family protein n=1 Tax=Mycolicibacterium sp. TaxID=2320850 RepID=UPI0025EB0D85|nr:hypothetical protein [Mycolicibacterium sp.]
MVAPERRTSGDLIAAAAIVAVVGMVIAAFWWHSSVRSTILRPAPSKAPGLVAPQAVPDSLQQRWTAVSSRTSAPVINGGNVITGEGHDMVGHDPLTGEQRWLYARDIDLCAVTYVYDLAVAVYPDSRGCGQVTGIRAATGVRGPSRTGYSDKHTVVRSDGSAVLSYGPTRLELWRTDLVRMLSYGEIDARIKPANTAIGAGCALMSAAGSDASAAVLESCKDEKDLRLTLLKPAKEEDEPDTKHVALPGLAADADARVLAVSGTKTAVYLPIPRPQVVVYDDAGNKVSETPLRVPPALPGATPALTRAGDYYTWWTGTAVMVFDSTLTYRYTIDAPTLGPATLMAGRFLIPVTDGLAVYDPANGTPERVIPVPHAAGDGPIIPAAAGPMVIEQRGATLTAFGP